jgi:hypothetical protein
VIDVKEGDDLDHWKVWLNRPDQRHDPWYPVQVDITPVRYHLHHPYAFVENDSVPIAIEQSRSWPRLKAEICFWQHCANAPRGARRLSAGGSAGYSARRSGADRYHVRLKLVDVNVDDASIRRRGYP